MSLKEMTIAYWDIILQNVIYKTHICEKINLIFQGSF